MAITQDNIDALESALMTGELTVEYDGKRTTFRSVKELKDALSYAKEAQAAASGTGDSQSFTSFIRD